MGWVANSYIVPSTPFYSFYKKDKQGWERGEWVATFYIVPSTLFYSF